MHTRIDFSATRTDVAEIPSLSIPAVQCFCQHKSARMLAYAFRAGKNQTVREPIFTQFPAEAFDDLLIADKGIELHHSNPSKVKMWRWTAFIRRAESPKSMASYAEASWRYPSRTRL